MTARFEIIWSPLAEETYVKALVELIPIAKRIGIG